MKLKFIRNVAVYGEHRERGTIHEIADKDATVLIADSAAVRTTESAAPAIETATAKRPAKKTAARK